MLIFAIALFGVALVNNQLGGDFLVSFIAVVLALFALDS